MRRGHMLLATEAALALVTLAAITGMHRLFLDGSYRGALALQAIVAHLVVATLRRNRVPLPAAAALTAAAAVLVITWTRFGDTIHYLLPSGGTLAAAGDDLAAAWHLFQDVKAPAPVENGFIVTTAVAIWVLVYVADWAAFRAGAAFEALLPAATLFLFAAALGAPGGRIASAALFALAALLFVLLHRTLTQEASSTWAASHRARGRWSLLGTGAALTGVAVLAGAVAGPRLPGADADPVIAWRDISKDEPTRVVPSPMISLRTQIVDQPNVEVFTVRSSAASYWRLTALDEFDGTIWKSSYGTEAADGELPRAIESPIASDSVAQTVTVIALNSVWLPAAYEPTHIDAGDQAVQVDEESSTLIVDRDVPTSDGMTYEVVSSIPRWTDDELRTATDDLPDDIADRYLALPANLPDDVATLAEGVVADAAATTPYDRARALQDFLRGDNFTYDVNVGPGHGSEALSSFLFETQRGYCEQFAGAFAAMARAVGLPTRVAVGYTWGAKDPQEPTLYRVRGTHGHAWPEVYFEGFGWAPFEPTPSRAPVGAEEWLGLTPAQSITGAGDGAPPPTPQGNGTTDPGGEGLSAGDEVRPPGVALDELLGSSTSEGRDGGGVPDAVRDALRLAVMGLLAYLVLVPLAVVGRRLIRRRRATRPADKVRLSWREAVARAKGAGVRLPVSLTMAETADRLAAALPNAGPEVRRMARTMERIAYAEVTPTPHEVDAARRAWASVDAEIRRTERWWERVLRYLDARQLRRTDRRSRLVTRHHTVAAAGR